MSEIPGTPLTLLGIAEIVVDDHGDNLKYCPESGEWYHWDGKRWSNDSEAAVQRCLKKTLRKLEDEANAQNRTRQENRLFQYERPSALASIATFASRDDRVRVHADKFDEDRMLLNTGSCTVDLRSLRQWPHLREDLITRLTPAEMSPAAECPQWLRFLNRIFKGDAEVIRHVQKSVGYTLTGSTAEQCAFMAYGDGANGKTTFLSVVLQLLGSYGRTVDFDLIADSGERRQVVEALELYGTRALVIPELPEGQKLDEAKLKHLTGGDRVVARRRGKPSWEFDPTQKLWVATNELPEIRGAKDAIWRRFQLIPFSVKISDEERDRLLKEKLVQELPGILRWAFEGVKAWQQEGLKPPAKLVAALEQYRNDQDRVRRYVRDRCVTGPTCVGIVTELREDYRDWAVKNNEPVLSAKVFGQRLEGLGYARGRGNNGARTRHGIALARAQVGVAPGQAAVSAVAPPSVSPGTPDTASRSVAALADGGEVRVDSVGDMDQPLTAAE